MKNETVFLGNGASAGDTRGSVLISAILLLALLAFVIGALNVSMRSSIKSSAYDLRERMAFYQAEAGVRHVIAYVNTNMVLSYVSNEQVRCPVPAGFSFSSNVLLRLEPSKAAYTFAVTGYYAGARAAIEVTASPRRLFPGGMCADGLITLKPNFGVYSYDSTVTNHPTALTSTHEATAGSNQGFSFSGSSVLDGIILLGGSVSGGVTNTIPAPAGFESNSVAIGRFDPDPLGSTNGALANAFARALTNNNNAASPDIAGRTLRIDETTSVLTSGVYSLDYFEMRSHATLTIQATPTNPVVIYLSGGMQSWPGSEINVTGDRPSSFYIFSNSTEPIIFLPSGNFQSCLYAPRADITMMPNGTFYGLMFGKTILAQPNGNLFEDVSLLRQFSMKELSITRWRRI